jgi:hypothetical protein
MTSINPPRPTSSPLRPAAGDELNSRPRPSSPSPTGGRGRRDVQDTPHTNPTHLDPGTNSGTTSTTTPRDPGIDRLLIAARVAQITGDAPGTFAIFIASEQARDHMAGRP